MTRIDNAAMSALCEFYQPTLMSLIPLHIASLLPEYHLTRLKNRQMTPVVKSELDIDDSFLFLSIATVDYHLIKLYKLSFLVVGR